MRLLYVGRRSEEKGRKKRKGRKEGQTHGRKNANNLKGRGSRKRTGTTTRKKRKRPSNRCPHPLNAVICSQFLYNCCCYYSPASYCAHPSLPPTLPSTFPLTNQTYKCTPLPPSLPSSLPHTSTTNTSSSVPSAFLASSNAATLIKKSPPSPSSLPSSLPPSSLSVLETGGGGFAGSL